MLTLCIIFIKINIKESYIRSYKVFLPKKNKMKKKKKKDMSEYYYSLDEYAARAGGAAKLSVLLQKRTRELIKGLPRLVEIDTDDPVEIAIEELFQNKISFQKPEEISYTEDNENKQ